MRLFLHIGTEKTGTTSIQNSLVRNSNLLEDSGIHVLKACGTGNMRALPAICMQIDKFDDYFKSKSIDTIEKKEAHSREILAKMSSEIEALPSHIHTVVISSEHFHSRLFSQKEVLRVAEVLGEFFSEIHVVCYIREQVAMCISHYSTAVKTGYRSPLRDFIESRCNPENQ